MSSSPFGGIAYNGSTYSVIAGDGNHPVNFVTWYDTLRFASWMNNGQGNGSTETGAYTLLGGTPTPSNANSIMRSAGATIVLPTVDEWYKAGYYNPANGSYYLSPTSKTFAFAVAPTSNPNSVNIENVVGNVTNVGAYSGTTSPFGAYDMGGDVAQWNEAIAIPNGFNPPTNSGREVPWQFV